MTAGDGEHPRDRFVRRLNDLFAVADLTNDRAATLADELVRARRVSGLSAISSARRARSTRGGSASGAG